MARGRFVRMLMFALCLAPVRAQERPLPKQEAFLRQARKHLQTDSEL